MTDQDAEPALRRVAVDVCENCLNGTPGQCHVPGCLFIRFNIEETPQPLRYMAVRLADWEDLETVLLHAVTYGDGDIPSMARRVISAMDPAVDCPAPGEKP